MFEGKNTFILIEKDTRICARVWGIQWWNPFCSISYQKEAMSRNVKGGSFLIILDCRKNVVSQRMVVIPVQKEISIKCKNVWGIQWWILFFSNFPIFKKKLWAKKEKGWGPILKVAFVKSCLWTKELICKRFVGTILFSYWSLSTPKRVFKFKTTDFEFYPSTLRLIRLFW